MSGKWLRFVLNRNGAIGIKCKPYRYLLRFLWISFSFMVPLSFVRYILNGVELREDYIFHANLPSRDLPANEISFHHNRTTFQNLTSFLNSKRPDWFQNVTKDGLAIVFSAYLDDMKNSKKLRVIGAKKRNYDLNISCLVFYRLPNNHGEDKFTYVTVPGYITEHIEIFSRSWAPVHYMCQLDNLPQNPYAVSVVPYSEKFTQLNRVFVKYTAEDSPKVYTVCLHNAFNFRSDVSTEIVEWIEVNRLLGADHFMIYNYSSHASNDKVLMWYEDEGIITIVPWDLPIYADLIFIGEVVVMQDCLYRNFYRSKYISHLDLDEYIVPRRPGISTVPELVAALPIRCGYIVRCAVYPVADGLSNTVQFDEKNKAEKYKLSTLLVGQRLSKIWKSKDRSKQLMRPACIELAGVHQIDGYTSLVSEMTFDPSDALLHHYRTGRPRFVKMGNKTEDSFMLKYASRLIDKVSYAWDMIKSNNSSRAA